MCWDAYDTHLKLDCDGVEVGLKFGEWGRSHDRDCFLPRYVLSSTSLGRSSVDISTSLNYLMFFQYCNFKEISHWWTSFVFVLIANCTVHNLNQDRRQVHCTIYLSLSIFTDSNSLLRSATKSHAPVFLAWSMHTEAANSLLSGHISVYCGPVWRR